MHLPVSGETTRVRFIVVTPDLPDAQPPEIYCSLSMDGWPAQGRALQRVAPNVYTAAGSLRAGVWIEYKFLREPSWKTVEKGSNGEELPNRGLTIKTGVGEQVALHHVLRWADRPRPSSTTVEFSQPGQAAGVFRRSTLTGDIRVHHRFHAPQFKNERTIMVYLPPGYDDAPDDHFPVLYMHDGNNIFDARTSFTGVEWGVDETAQRLIQEGRLRRLIIIGVFNTPQRLEEYTPFRDPLRGGGLADAYLDFLVSMLKPFIDKTYRTLADRAHTGIAGSSLGGLCSLYALFARPDVFGLAGALSPALWWANRHIISFVRAAGTPSPIRLWLDTGTEEGEPTGPLVEFRKAVPDCRRLVKTLRAMGYQEDEDFQYEEVSGARHHELDWAQRVDRFLLYLFGGEPVGAAPTDELATPERHSLAR
jgi:predicted alpha/beta superfamily hydrolase